MRFFIVCLTLHMACVSTGQDFPSSSLAKKAKNNYEAEVKRLDKLYAEALMKTKAKYNEELESARKSALIRNKLNEAQQIVEIQKKLKQKGIPENKPWLTGTQWLCKPHNDYRNFLVSGSEHRKNNKLVRKTPWIFIGDNKAMVISERELPSKHIWIWQFGNNRETSEVSTYTLEGKGTFERIK